MGRPLFDVHDICDCRFVGHCVGTDIFFYRRSGRTVPCLYVRFVGACGRCTVSRFLGENRARVSRERDYALVFAVDGVAGGGYVLVLGNALASAVCVLREYASADGVFCVDSRFSDEAFAVVADRSDGDVDVDFRSFGIFKTGRGGTARP